MGFDFNQQTEEPLDVTQYAADILRRLPLRYVHRGLLPGILMHHTLRGSAYLLPDDYCEKVWSAGRWLASYILKHPDQFKGKHVLDIGTGSGIVAIAAALAGAEVTALDGSDKAICLTQMNAQANGVLIKTTKQYVTDQTPLPDFDILTATDTMYSTSVSNAFVHIFKNEAKSILAKRTVYICDQSGWTDTGFSKFRDKITATGAYLEVIKGGDKFVGIESPINNNPVTAVRIGIALR